MDVQDIVNTVSQKAGLDQATTEKVVGTIFSVLEHEAEGTSASSFFAKIPGADALAQKYDVMAAAPAGGGGFLTAGRARRRSRRESRRIGQRYCGAQGIRP
ncbi:hypothetical protein [Mesorhizobium sophorae]|uniref:hypothetical protein n=1 Tax=Mesorhizobium sophorae TaxID=1300294 RepID=UPI001FDA80AC|nr:hypothetical protein [Mesorhizobium sophorae]